MKDGNDMSKTLFRWTAWLLVVTSLFSGMAWSAVAETKPAQPENLSQYKTLSVGYAGPEVSALKQRMFELGYFRTNVVNESYSANTADYVKKFEEMNGLPVDGIADQEMQVLFFSDNARKSDGSLFVPEQVVRRFDSDLAGTDEEKQINQRFADFLAGKGEYSDHNIKKLLFKVRYNQGTKVDLGYLMGHGTYEMQAIVLTHKIVDGYCFIALGVKNRDGKRRITPVFYPFETVFKSASDSGLDFLIYNYGTGYMFTKIEDEEEFSSFLIDNYDKVMVFHFLAVDLEEIAGLYRQKQFHPVYYSEYFPQMKYIRNLLSDLFIPMNKKDLSIEAKAVFKSLEKGRMLSIENYQGFFDAILNKGELPAVFYFSPK